MKALLLALGLVFVAMAADAQCIRGHYNRFGEWVPYHCLYAPPAYEVAPPGVYVAPFGVAPYPGWVWGWWGGRWGWHEPHYRDRR